MCDKHFFFFFLFLILNSRTIPTQYYKLRLLSFSSLFSVLWGRRIWQPWPIPYQAQGPRRGRRNVRGWTRKVQAAGRHCRGPSCPWPTKVTEGESSTPSKTALPGVPNKRTNTVDQLWGHGGGAILGEAVTFALNAHSWQSSHINEEMTLEQYHLIFYNS